MGFRRPIGRGNRPTTGLSFLRADDLKGRQRKDTHTAATNMFLRAKQTEPRSGAAIRPRRCQRRFRGAAPSEQESGERVFTPRKTDGRTNKRKNELTNKQTIRQTNKQVDEQTDKQANKLINK